MLLRLGYYCTIKSCCECIRPLHCLIASLAVGLDRWMDLLSSLIIERGHTLRPGQNDSFKKHWYFGSIFTKFRLNPKISSKRSNFMKLNLPCQLDEQFNVPVRKRGEPQSLGLGLELRVSDKGARRQLHTVL